MLTVARECPVGQVARRRPADEPATARALRLRVTPGLTIDVTGDTSRCILAVAVRHHEPRDVDKVGRQVADRLTEAVRRDAEAVNVARASVDGVIARAE